MNSASATDNSRFIDGLNEYRAVRYADENFIYLCSEDDTIVYSSPDSNGKKLYKLQKGSKVEIEVNDSSGWTEITTEAGNGYVQSEALAKVEEEKDTLAAYGVEESIYAIADNIEIHSKRSMTSSCIDITCQGTPYKIVKLPSHLDDSLESMKKWVEIETIGGETGFIQYRFVDLGYNYPAPEAITEESPAIENNTASVTISAELLTRTSSIGLGRSARLAEGLAPADYVFINAGKANVPNMAIRGTGTTTELRKSIVKTAVKYVGNRYVWGGTDLNNGVDCSGFVQGIYKLFGYSINRVAEDQSKNGRRVDPYSVQPGDLVFQADKTGHIYHVQMYIGNGQIVHASNSKPYPNGGVRIGDYDPASIYCAVNIVGD